MNVLGWRAQERGNDAVAIVEVSNDELHRLQMVEKVSTPILSLVLNLAWTSEQLVEFLAKGAPEPKSK